MRAAISRRTTPDTISSRCRSSGRPGGGLGGLSEDYLHTVEAMRLYVRRLSPGGFLSITRFVQLPPRDALKLLATTIAALKSTGVREPGRRLLMIRGWQTVTLLVKNGEITDSGRRAHARVLRTARRSTSRGFRICPARSRTGDNVLPQPWFHDGARALLGPQAARFAADYPFDIRPATDDRPYFQNFFRWSSFSEAWRNRGRGGMALLEAGYAVLAVTVLQAVTRRHRVDRPAALPARPAARPSGTSDGACSAISPASVSPFSSSRSSSCRRCCSSSIIRPWRSRWCSPLS